MRHVTTLTGCVVIVRAIILACLVLAQDSVGSTASEAQSRIDDDLAIGLPIVVHVTVALCDNENQGLVRVTIAPRQRQGSGFASLLGRV